MDSDSDNEEVRPPLPSLADLDSSSHPKEAQRETNCIDGVHASNDPGTQEESSMIVKLPATESEKLLFQPIALEEQTHEISKGPFLLLAPPVNSSDDCPSNDKKLLLSFVVDDADDPAVDGDKAAEARAVLQVGLISSQTVDGSPPRNSRTMERKPTVFLEPAIEDDIKKSSERSLFQPIHYDADGEDGFDSESDIEADAGGEIFCLLQNLQLEPSSYLTTIRDAGMEIEKEMVQRSSRFFTKIPIDVGVPRRKNQLWEIPLDEPNISSGIDQLSTAEPRPNHDDDTFALAIVRGKPAAEPALEPLTASKLMQELKLADNSSTDTVGSDLSNPPDKTEKELQLEAVATLEVTCSLCGSVAELNDRDPATLRALVRNLADGGPSERLREAVQLHILSVCRSLIDVPNGPQEYLDYCATNEQYRLALQPNAEEFFIKVREIFPVCSTTKVGPSATGGSSRNTGGPATMLGGQLIRTTILVDANQVCNNPELRRICAQLSDKLNVICLERNMGDRVTFEFDPQSACCYATFPVAGGGGPQAATAWASHTAKWLVLEAAKYQSIRLILQLTDSTPDATTRAAIRNLTATLAMLAHPAPQIRLLLAFDADGAAMMVRSAIDECAHGNPEWYRDRDMLPEVVDADTEQRVAFLRQFPTLTNTRAEEIALGESLVEFIQRIALDAGSPIAPIIHAWLLPEIPTISRPTQGQSENAAGFRRPQPPMQVESIVDDDGNADAASTSPVTPAPRAHRKRRLALERDEGGSNQTRLTWSYINE